MLFVVAIRASAFDLTSLEPDAGVWVSTGVTEEIALAWDARVAGITAGTDVAAGDWESTAAIVFAGGSVGCTGTLVAPSVVLTAGHCAGGIVGVVVGADSLANGSGEYIPATSTRKYAKKYWRSYDLAIVRLAWPSVYAPATLALDCVETTYVVDGQDSVIVGYGSTDPWGYVYVDELQEAHVDIVDADCSTVGEGCVNAIRPTGELIAASTTGADTCYGDSGGPLYLDVPEGVFLAGVTSRATYSAGWACGSSDGGIYVRPDNNIATWIETTAGVVLPRPTCAPPPPEPVADRSAADPEVEAATVEPTGCDHSGGVGWLVGLPALLAVRRRRG